MPAMSICGMLASVSCRCAGMTGNSTFTPWSKGVLDATDYNGYMTLEYEHDPWMDCDQVDVMTETIKMRDEMRRLLALYAIAQE